MSQWKTGQKDLFIVLLESIESCFQSTISEFADDPSEKNADRVKKCVELIKHMVNCDRPRGVAFNRSSETENITTEASKTSRLQGEMIDLVGILVSKADRLEPEFALLQLEIIIILAKNATKDFKNAIYDFLYNEIIQGAKTEDILVRNHELVSSWLLPKYNLSRKIAEKTAKETIVEVAAEKGEEAAAEEPETHQFRFSKPKTSIFDGVSSILLDLSRGSASSCASILEEMAAEPESLEPLLRVLFDEISKATGDQKSQSIAESFTMKLFQRPRGGVWQKCCGTILKYSHENLKDKLNSELEHALSEVSKLEELVMLTEIRLYDPRADNVAVLPQIGSNLARVISITWDFEEAGLSNLINTAHSKLPETFEVVIKCFVYELLKFFHTDVSTISYACCMRVFEQLKFLSHQTLDENDDEELFTVDENVLGFLRAVFDDLTIAFNMKNNISTKIAPLSKISGCLYQCPDENFDLCAKDLLLLLLIEKGLAILSLQPTQLTIEISSLVRDYLKPFNNFSVQSLDAFKAIRLSNESSVEILSYFIYEINSSRSTAESEVSKFIKNTGGECFGSTEDELDIRVSEVLTAENLEQDSVQESIAVIGRLSDDPSRIIGVLAQVVENGIENWKIKQQRNLAMLLNAAVKFARSNLTNEQWDFVFCNITSWLENISSMEDSFGIDALCLLNEVLGVLATLTEFFNSPGALADPSLPADMLDTWKEFFVPQISGSILTIFFKLVSNKNDFPEVLLYSIIKSLSDSISKIGLDELQNFEPTLKLSVDHSDVLPDEINSLINHSFKLHVHLISRAYD